MQLLPVVADPVSEYKMSKQDIDIGVQGNDGTGDSIRESFRKVNENFTELYAVFGAGGQIRFTNLSDAPLKLIDGIMTPSYNSNDLIMGATDGSRLSARALIPGEGITIDVTNPNSVTITNSLSTTASDPAPRLGGPLNAQGFSVGKLANPSEALVTAFNAVHGPKGYTTTINELAISKGYADANYIKASGGTATDALRVRAEPTLPQISDPDYDSNLPGNYVASEAMQRKDTVRRSGDNMTGELLLSDHPGALAGVGTPNGADDLQAASKYYVDNSTYSSAVNLFVNTKGDDTQQLSPKGKEGRFWNYAYRSVGAAALAADSLITVSQTEPGPYRQRLAYTQGVNQTFSTISEFKINGGNSADNGYVAAFDLLRANKEFIQYETIAYINNKYVNRFTYDKVKCQRDIGLILDAVAKDLVLDTNFNSVRAATRYYDVSSAKVLSNQLLQTVDGIKYARDKLLNFAYDTTSLQNYVNNIIDAICLDLIYQSNLQTTFVAIAYTTAETDVELLEFVSTLVNLKASLLALDAVTDVPASVTFISNLIDSMIGILQGDSLPTIVFPSLSSTNDAQVAARELLLANIPFIQSEVIAYLSNEFPGLSYSATTCKRDIQFMVWAVIYDTVYGGNSLSNYAGNRYWINAVRQIAVGEVPATLAAIKYINGLTEYVLQNQTPPITYQQTSRQYRNQTYSGAVGTGTNAAAVRLGVKEKFDIILSIVATGSLSYDQAKCSRDVGLIIDAVTTDLVFGTNYNSVTAGLSYLRSYSSVVTSSQSGQTIAGVNKARDLVLALVSDAGARTLITANMKIVTDIISGGYLAAPIVTYPSPSTTTNIIRAVAVLRANRTFLQEETVAYVNDTQNPGAIPRYDASICFRDTGYVIDAICFDLLYGGNSATVVSGNSYVNGALNVIAGEITANINAYTHLQELITNVITNVVIVKATSNSASQNITLTPGTGAEGTTASTLIGNLITLINSGSVATVGPTFSNGNGTYNTIRTTIATSKTSIAASVITFLNATYYTVIPSTIANAPNELRGIRTAILGTSNVNRNAISGAQITFINTTFPVINDTASLAKINTSFQYIIDLLNNGIGARPTVTYTAPASLDVGIANAVLLMLGNITFVQEEVVGYIKNQYPSLTFDNDKCKRDLKYIIEAVSYDLLYGGNAGSTYAAQCYWVASVSQVPGQLAQTINAINYAQTLLVDLTQNVVQSISYQTPSFNSPQYRNTGLSGGSAASTTIGVLFNLIKNIVTNNPGDVVATDPDLTSVDYSQIKQDIGTIIQSNVDVIKSEVTTYLDKTYAGGFNYDEAICFRDVGYIIESQAIDLITGGTFQSVNAGQSYYRNTSAKAIAIGTQYRETLDGILYAQSVATQVLNKTSTTRYQTLYTQKTDLTGLTLPSSVIGIGIGSGTANPSTAAKNDFTTNMATLISIINNGFGVAPVPSFGNATWTVKFTNGGNGFVDQGSPANNDILPAKVLVGVGSSAYSTIVTYTQGSVGGTGNIDAITCRLTKPAYYEVGEQLEFGEIVKELQIVIFVEAGIYYEDYPIKLATNVSIKGDEFRRTIIRPKDRISQSPWRKTLFYRDAVIDGMQLGLIDNSIDFRSATNATPSATSNEIVITLGVGTAPQSWIGKVFQDDVGSPIAGKAIINSVSNNFMNCTVVYPFATATTLSNSQWHIYDTVKYGRHYLTNPLDVSSLAKNNKEMDVFLCNDATRVSNLSLQGHGGFAMVLDPTGQILTKSPYGQVCSSFSQSINRKRFAGGQYIDGFAGRLRGTIVANANSGKTLTITGNVNSGLDVRPPQPPCAFFISGTRYQINDIVSYNSTTRTAVLTLDNATPWDGGFTYNQSKCSRDVGLILDGLGYDIAYGTNYQAVTAGRSYLRSYSSVVLGNVQLPKTISALNQLRDTVVALSGVDATADAAIISRMNTITAILSGGITSVPALVYTNPSWQTAGVNNAKAILISNRAFIQEEVTAWINDNFNVALITNYSPIKCARDVGYVVDAVVYDLLYGGNSATYDAAASYYLAGISYINGQETVTAAAYGRMKAVLQQIVVNTTVTKSSTNTATQIKDLVNPGDAPSATTIGTLMDVLIDIVPDNSTVTAKTYPTNFTGVSSSLTTARSTINTSRSTLQAYVIDFLNNGLGTVINIEMGGNKSMLANDFAMINDLGYGIVANNGGVTEQVSTFSYYCHTHYWASNGGQIRSVAGSNSHGNYGLRSSGYDVTELPDEVNLANNMMQPARVYKQGDFALDMTPTATSQSVAVYILGYDYIPMNVSELEIDHGLDGLGIVRYEVSSVERTAVTINAVNVIKLNLSRAGNGGTSSVGLVSALYDGQTVQLRILQNAKYLGIANVNPTRPSTALQYSNNLADIYRVIVYNLTESVGELLPANVAVLQTDTSFIYYKFVIDPATLNTVDPIESSKKMGGQVGDTRLAVIAITNSAIIAQVNKGLYLFSWNGRVHNVLSYTASLATVITAYNPTGSSGTTLVVNDTTGIVAGMLISGTGFTTQTVVTVNSLTQLTISGAPSTTPSGNLSFASTIPPYLTISPVAVKNIGTTGSPVNALSYSSKTSNANATFFVTYDIPWQETAPIVDSYLTMTGNSNANYNAAKQITSLTNQTVITVADTSAISVGMVVTASTITGACNVTAINNARQFTVTPAQYIPAGTSVVATKIATLGALVITNPGSNYARAPIITITGGGASIDAKATATVAGGNIVAIQVVNPGYGYTSIPTITLEVVGDNNAVLTPVLTAIASTNVTASAGVSSSTAKVAYLTDPGTVGTEITIASLTFTSKTLVSGTTYNVLFGFGSTTAPTTNKYYKISGNANPLYNGLWKCTASSTTSITLQYPYDPGTFVTTSGITISSATKSGSGPYLVNYTIPSQTNVPQLGIYYTVTGNANALTNTTLTATATTVSSDVTTPNWVTVSATGRLAVGCPITFATTIGNIVSGTQYFVAGIQSSTAITLTTIQFGAVMIQITASGSSIGTFGLQSTTTSATSIVLTYGSDPGTYGANTTTITPVATSTSVTTVATSATTKATGIAKPFYANNPTTVRLGYPQGSIGQVTTRISTCRATGHDFLDIGTGGYSTTNYPYQIYGNPAITKKPEQEIYEEGVGRVFYVTTDQNGIFRVGRYFTVDQGTGTVTFSASIALSNLDGIGFKRGVVVSEFSTDSTMTNNAPDTVPVQSATRGYIDKRLGIDHGGSPVAAASLIGSGYMSLGGTLGMKANMNLNNNNIINLSAPTNSNDASTKAYVDTQVALVDASYKLTDTYYGTPAAGEFHVAPGGNVNGIVTAGVSGDLSATFTMGSPSTLSVAITSLLANDVTTITVANAAGYPAGPGYLKVDNEIFSYGTVNYGANRFDTVVRLSTRTTGKFNLNTGNTSATHTVGAPVNSLDNAVLNFQINADTIINADINSAAAIAQSKLTLNIATATASSPTGTAAQKQAASGLSSFDTTYLTVTDGWVTIKDNSIPQSKHSNIGNGSILGNFSGAATFPQEITALTVVNNGFAQKFTTSVGAMTYGGSSGSAAILSITTDGTASTLVKYGTSGEIDTKFLKVDGYTVLDTGSNTLQLFTPGGYQFLGAVGSSGANFVATVGGTWDYSGATLKAPTITTGGAATGGSIVGQYAVQASSQIDFSLGTLKSNNLTTGAAGTAGTLTGQWALSAASQFDATAGTLKSYTLTTGSSTAAGTITGAWGITGTLAATYADLAEYYEGDQEYEAGTVLVFGGDKEVTTTTMINDTRSAGVVTTDPAYIMNADQTGIKVCIALAGRVPVKVIGRVNKGDMLTTSATPGYAVRANDPKLGAVIGKALEDKDYGEAGVIQVAVGRV